LFGHEKGALPEPSRRRSGASKWPIKAPCFWTK
jgi:hypothetical protein